MRRSLDPWIKRRLRLLALTAVVVGASLLGEWYYAGLVGSASLQAQARGFNSAADSFTYFAVITSIAAFFMLLGLILRIRDGLKKFRLSDVLFTTDVAEEVMASPRSAETERLPWRYFIPRAVVMVSITIIIIHMSNVLDILSRRSCMSCLLMPISIVAFLLVVASAFQYHSAEVFSPEKISPILKNVHIVTCRWNPLVLLSRDLAAEGALAGGVLFLFKMAYRLPWLGDPSLRAAIRVETPTTGFVARIDAHSIEVEPPEALASLEHLARGVRASLLTHEGAELIVTPSYVQVVLLERPVIYQLIAALDRALRVRPENVQALDAGYRGGGDRPHASPSAIERFEARAQKAWMSFPKLLRSTENG